MAYCTVADVRRLTGISSTAVISDADLAELIADADAKIDAKITVPNPTPRRIKRLSTLLASIDLYNRLDLRGGFSSGDVSVSNQEVEGSLKRWEAEVEEIFQEYSDDTPFIAHSEEIE